jgi:hypothetical protein
MSLRVIGAGWPRTGTTSLKVALETLLPGNCHHMYDLFADIGQVEVWERALEGDLSGVHKVMSRYVACLDWPASFFWRELLDANPSAIVLLSVRDPQDWWKSMCSTIVPLSDGTHHPAGDDNRRYIPMITTLMQRAIDAPDWTHVDQVLARYERSNAEVRAECPPQRLIEWTPGDGWEPICAGLGIPEPDRPYPWVNTANQFNQMASSIFGTI